MRLKEFVKTTLIEVIEGVQEAQSATAASGDMINPKPMYSADSAPKGKLFATQDRSLIHMVDFDVAVTVQDSTEAGAEAGIVVFGIGIGGKGKATAQESAISRVRFQVPITLPLAGQSAEKTAPEALARRTREPS